MKMIFVGGPCDGLESRDDYGNETMMVHHGPKAMHLYDRVAKDRFEYWGSFADDGDDGPWRE